MRRSLQSKLVLTYVALVSLALLVVTVVALRALRAEYLETHEYVVATQARLIALMLTEYRESEPGLSSSRMEAIAQDFRWRPEAQIALLTGARLRASRGTPLPPEVAAALGGRGAEGAHAAVRFDPATGQARVFAAEPVGPGRPPSAVVQVSMPVAWVSAELRGLWPAFAGALLLGLGTAWLVGRWLAGGLTGPLRTLTRAAESMRDGHFEPIPDTRRNDEIGRLSQAFRATAAELRDTIQGLRDERNKVDAILTSMVDAVVATDRYGNLVHANPAANELLGLEASMPGRAGAGALPGPLVAMLDEAIAQEHPVAAELPGNGSDRLLEVHCVPIKGNGMVAGAVAVLRDMSELRRSERLRRELTANVSHELRTPLTSIKGFTETLLAGAMRDDALCSRFLTIIQTEADRLEKLVDDLMDLSRLENRAVSLQLTPVGVAALVEDVVARLRPAAGTRQLQVQGERDDVNVLADRDRLDQVLTNLIGNAIKFTPETGQVTVGWREQNGQVEVSVRDDGQGIAPEDLPYVFDRFYKADRSRSSHEGSGLGLAIARQIVEAHGGSIAMQAAPGAGSAVTFSLPRADRAARIVVRL